MLHNGTVLNNGVRLRIRLLWQKFVFLSLPHAFAFCKNDPINALYHQEQNIPYHHKGKILSTFLPLTYWKGDILCIPWWALLAFISISSIYFWLTDRTHWLIEILYQSVFPLNTISITLNYSIMSLSLKILEEEIWINHGQELSFTMAY